MLPPILGRTIVVSFTNSNFLSRSYFDGTPVGTTIGYWRGKIGFTLHLTLIGASAG